MANRICPRRCLVSMASPISPGSGEAESAPVAEVQQFLLPGGINGLGEDIPSKYFFNIFADYPAGQEPIRADGANR